MSLIQCQGLSKQFGTKQALKNINLSLEAGAPIALVGPNGAGKTTLFSLLCGYLTPSTGSITIMGEAPSSPKLLGNIAALPQDAQLDPNISIVQQLSYFARLQGMDNKAAQKEAMRVLELVGLSDVAQQKPNQLSHGMGKRVAIAQTLIGSPKLILLDEPTAGLDPANAKKVRDLVKSLSTSTTFMISSHNLDELEKLCDQVIYLDEGELNQAISLRETNYDTEYLTLTMSHCDDVALKQALSAMPAVLNVSSNQSQVFIIQLQPSLAPYQFETALLELLREHQWQYKMLLKGRTLEETLFS
ncbi:ABC transporter ATP-binding protein [Shewanella sp. A25]|nr:ABC transporter ATP-binding protein [Shewanella shenzhenensis]